VTVRLLQVREVYGLRRSVLRAADPAATVHYPTDDDPATWHMGAVDDVGTVVATSTFFAEPCPLDPASAGALRLRSMAVLPARQGEGIGRAVLEHALARARAQGATFVWANARDSALGFYRRCGFEISELHFVEPETGLAHTVVTRALG